MANDRVFIRCKGCGERRLFFAFWAGGTAGPVFQRTGAPLDPMQAQTVPDFDGAQQWVWQHLQECGDAFGMSLNGDPRFELVTESKSKA